MVIRQSVVLCGLLFLSSCSQPNPVTPENGSKDTTATDASVEGAALPEPKPQANDREKETTLPVTKERASRIEVGDKAPDFELKDQDGRQHTLEDLLKQGMVALVFFRSADW